MKKQVYSKITTKHERIYPIDGEYYNNQRCHWNCYRYAKLHKCKIASVICYSIHGDLIAHFVNYNPKTKQYIENTTGGTPIYTEYYLVRHFDLDDFYPDKELELLKVYICDMFTPWYRFWNKITWRHF